MKMKCKRLLSLLLVFVMVLGLMPTTAFATPTEMPAVKETSISVASSSNAVLDDEMIASSSDAELNVEEEATPSNAEPTVGVFSVSKNGDNGEIVFDTMEALIAEIESSDMTERILRYVGEEEFVLTEDLAVPPFISLKVRGTDITVEENVTFEVASWLSCDQDVIVDGTMITNGRVEIDGDLTVNGEMKTTWDLDADNLFVNGTMKANGWMTIAQSIENNGLMMVYNGFSVGKRLSVAENAALELYDCSIDMYKDYVIEGMDKIYSTFGQYICVNYAVTSVAEMEAALDIAAKETNRAIYYFIWINGEQVTTRNFEFVNNMVVPSNTRLQLDNIDSITLKPGVGLTVNGIMQVYIPLYVEGTLLNNSRVEVANQTGRDYRPPFDGVLEIKQGGQYDGGADLWIYTDKDVTNIDHIAIGLKRTFYKSVESDHILWYGAGGGGRPSDLNFRTFTELEEQLKLEGDQYTTLHYEGDSTLTIERDIVIPDNMEIEAHRSHMVIPAGVTVTCDGSIYIGNLEVAGTLNIGNWLNVNNSLTVSGTVTAKQSFAVGSEVESKLEITNTGRVELNRGAIDVQYPGQVIGLERIVRNSNNPAIVFNCRFMDMNELKSLTNTVVNDTEFAEDKRVEYRFDIPWDYSQNKSEFVFTEDITIPAKANLQLYGDLTFVIDENVTLTNNGFIWISSPLVVNGKLDNKGDLAVSYRPGDQNTDDHGTISLGANGVIEHDHEKDFRVQVDPSVNDITDVLPWFNTTDHEYKEDIWENGKTTAWRVNFVHGLIKLATPTELMWGVEYRETWWNEDPATGKITVNLEKMTKPGFMSWKTELPDQARVQVYIYRVGEGQPCAYDTWGFDPQVQPEYRSVDTFMRADLPSGDYYFTVQSIGDYKTYRNSDVATSGVYKFKKPAANLPAIDPASLVWEDRNDNFVMWANWDGSSTSQYADGFELDLYYSKTENGTYELFGGSRGRGALESDSPLADQWFQEKGEGYYKYKVRYLSGNMDKIGNGPWSDFSQVLDLKKIPQMMNDTLDQIEQNAQQMTPDQVKNAVQALDKEDLKKTLLVDQENKEATQTLADLENMVGGQATVSVSQAASAFNQADVSVVGANLNNSAGTTDPITLVIDKPEKEHVIPERFDSSVAVRFSMTLANVADPQNLEVPVKITLPVPKSINPDFLVILHYHQDGTREWIWPYVHEMNGKLYADFVVTSFSDFIMTEEIPENSTGNGGGSSNDSEHDGGSSSGSSSSVKAQSKKEKLPEYVVSGQWTTVDGKWMFADGTGEVYKNRWAAVENPYADTKAGQSAFDWFFFDANGCMVTGWFFDGIHWYYLNPVSDGTQGRMFTGWQLIDGKWYYLNPVSDGTKGAMAADTWIDSYYVDVNGAWDETKTK